MTKYTLDETWKHCLQLWKWIAEEIKANSELGVVELKSKWFKKHDFGHIWGACFFCGWVTENPDAAGCASCPGKLVDPEFGCGNPEYCHYNHPIKFYEKLLELDKKRKE